MIKNVFLGVIILCVVIVGCNKNKNFNYNRAESKLFGFYFMLPSLEKVIKVNDMQVNPYDSIYKYVDIMEESNSNTIYHNILKLKADLLVRDYNHAIENYLDVNSFGIEFFQGIANEKIGQVSQAQIHFKKAQTIADIKNDVFEKLLAELYISGDIKKFQEQLKTEITEGNMLILQSGNFLQENSDKNSITSVLLHDVNNYLYN